jgi:hypothetical protein
LLPGKVRKMELFLLSALVVGGLGAAVVIGAAAVLAGNRKYRTDQVRGYRRQPEPGARDRRQSINPQLLQDVIINEPGARDRRQSIEFSCPAGLCMPQRFYAPLTGEPAHTAEDREYTSDQVPDYNPNWNQAAPDQVPEWEPLDLPIEVPNWPVKVWPK